MRITALIENTAAAEHITAEHGLSLYLEIGERKILFDAGQTGAFADNAARLGIDLAAIDTAVLSHGHYDHGGGLARFLALNDHAPIYLTEHAFGAHYNGTVKYIGLAPTLQARGRLRFCGNETDLGDGMTLLTCNALPRPYPTDSAGLCRRTDDGFVPDDFTHEHYLLIREKGRTVLISGCSHKGIRNLAEWFCPDVLVGGFHFKNLDPDGDGRAALDEAAAALLLSPTRYYTCHCTGEAQYAYLKARMGERLAYLRGGDTVEI